jgi:hypothetical protein
MLTLVSSDPFLNSLCTILILMASVIWVWMVIIVMIDIFSRTAFRGWARPPGRADHGSRTPCRIRGKAEPAIFQSTKESV